MHQTDLHLLGTAPPMPPRHLFRSPFPCQLFFPAVAGGPTWPEWEACTHHSNSMGTYSPARVVSENQHEQASSSRTPQNSMHAGAPCTHRNAFSNTTSQAGHAVQSKPCIGQRPTLPCGVLVSSRQRYVRARSAHTSKGECMATAVTSLPQIVVR
jgi:hypothetical protein